MQSRSMLGGRSKLSLALAFCMILASGVATFAHADWQNSTLPRVESELLEQSRRLSTMSEAWAKDVKGRVDFALYKIKNARMSSSPAAEFTHYSHACQALSDERSLLVAAQLSDYSDSVFIEQLIEKTFEHREALGCRE